MTAPILGLHHVTATVDDAQADLDFGAGLLGLRLVKKTVNFDNPFVYHFYYGDETGTPGTIWTTFPYRDHGVRPGRIGAGQVTATTFAVPPGSLGAWRDRLAAHNVATEAIVDRFGANGLALRDSSGLHIELLESADDRVPWTGAGLDDSMAIRGVHSVTLTSRAAASTVDFMTDVLGFVTAGLHRDRTRLAVGDQGSGHIFDVIDGHGRQPGVNGLGTVHHVAMAVRSADDQLEMRRRLVDRGVIVTPVQDRQYFQSIYFREPGGVLFEIATMSPGFAVDEPVETLGRALKLPDWEEPNRQAIEAGLPGVTHPDESHH
jgi:glyoxalase family protein